MDVENRALPDKHQESFEEAHTELDRRIYHLKTLYDLSKDIFGTVECETILKNFLLMTMGSFGVLKGFIYTRNLCSPETNPMVSLGYKEDEIDVLAQGGSRILREWKKEQPVLEDSHLEVFGPTAHAVVLALPFFLDETCAGLLGLSAKILGEPYNGDDKELLVTLVNNLVVALKNAKSFEEISRLNQELQEKNVALEKSLSELQAAMKKVEILESIKANLSKFVPNTVTRLLEKSPTFSLSEAEERDVSVLFVDIEGYTRLSERLPSAKLNELVERYFSVFMDAIYENNGDVNETAGDGLMVLYLSEDEKQNALESVNTALAIREKVALISQEEKISSEPLIVNMGINSGRALVGAVKFESYTGSRWTYTARGMVTNIAARIAALATNGEILISTATAERVQDRTSLIPLGGFTLKNVSDTVEVFKVEGEISC